jgi:hypothetical protein
MSKLPSIFLKTNKLQIIILKPIFHPCTAAIQCDILPYNCYFQSQSASSEERLLQQVAGLQQLLPLREFELEMERLRTRGEHLRAQSDVLTLALDEARANSEKLTLLCGKFVQ